MANQKTNQVLELLRLLKKKYPDRNSFTLADFREITRSLPPHKTYELTQADSPNRQDNYLSDIHKNRTTKPKHPKVARIKINGIFHYYPNPPYTY